MNSRCSALSEARTHQPLSEAGAPTFTSSTISQPSAASASIELADVEEGGGKPMSMGKAMPIPAAAAVMEPANSRCTALDDARSHAVFAASSSSPAVVGAGASVLMGPSYVMDYPLSIQRGFRRKMLTILALQLSLTMAVGLLTLYAPPLIDGNPAICKVFPAQSIQTLILGVVCVIALPALSSVKDRHPWNMVAVTAWTLLWGVFLAAAHVPGGLLKSNVLFVMFGACTLGVILLTIFSTCCTFRDAETGEKSLMSFGSAGTLAWILTVIAAFVFYANTTSHYETVAHFIAGLIGMTCLFSWISYDSAKLSAKMQPDDYMKGVVYFYTDFLIVCCCCLFTSCIGSAVS